jgi:hypothetical protein
MLAVGFVIDHRSWAPGRKTDIDAAALAADRAWTPTVASTPKEVHPMAELTDDDAKVLRGAVGGGVKDGMLNGTVLAKLRDEVVRPVVEPYLRAMADQAGVGAGILAAISADLDRLADQVAGQDDPVAPGPAAKPVGTR